MYPHSPNPTLLRRYLEGACAPEEVEQVGAWLRQPGAEAAFARWLEGFEAEEVLLDAAPAPELGAPARSRMWLNIRREIGRRRGAVRPRRVRLAAWHGAVAAVLVAGLVLFGYLRRPEPVAGPPAFREYVNPAGRRIALALGDGSKVWLNAASSIRFPDPFGEDRREVWLSGEAFFEVASDTARPFLVHAGGVETRVLGTSFNVRAYSEEPVEVTVTAGKVGVADSLALGQGVLLVPDERAVFHAAERQLTKHAGADARSAAAWREGRLVFKARSLASIYRALERHYDVEIDAGGAAFERCILSATIEASEPLDRVLEVLGAYVGANHDRIGRRVVVRSITC